LAVLVLLAGLAVFGLTVSSAQAATELPKADSYESVVRVERNGIVKVAETWKPSNSADGGFYTEIVTRQHFQDDIDHVIEIGDVRASVNDKQATPQVSTEGDVTTIRVDDAGKGDTVKFDYTATGAVTETATGTEFRLTPLHGLGGVKEAVVNLSSPAPSYIRCNAGPLGGSSPCTLSQASEAAPFFQQRNLAAGQTMTVIAGFPPGEVQASTIVEYRKSIRRAFLADPAHLGVTAAVLVIGGVVLYLLYLRRGRDAVDASRVVPASLFSRSHDQVSFDPPQALRPGEIGTLIDERVDPVDVTSSILDLAVRGHLTITELSRTGEFARVDWLLTRTGREPDPLQPYEQSLLAGLFGGTGVAPREGNSGESDEVKVSELGPKVRAQLGAIQDALYDEVVKHGWFAERPDRSRSKWSTIGLALVGGGIVLTLLLAFLTTWGLLGLAVVVLGAALTLLGSYMPAKSPEAGRVVGQIASLRGELLELDINSELPRDRHEELCSRALPYAVVLGGAERWIDALVATDTDDLPDEGFAWYRGPENWHLQDLPDSLKNLTISLTGALFSR
jgi:hypothetical protein